MDDQAWAMTGLVALAAGYQRSQARYSADPLLGVLLALGFSDARTKEDLRVWWRKSPANPDVSIAARLSDAVPEGEWQEVTDRLGDLGLARALGYWRDASILTEECGGLAVTALGLDLTRVLIRLPAELVQEAQHSRPRGIIGQSVRAVALLAPEHLCGVQVRFKGHRRGGLTASGDRACDALGELVRAFPDRGAVLRVTSASSPRFCHHGRWPSSDHLRGDARRVGRRRPVDRQVLVRVDGPRGCCGGTAGRRSCWAARRAVPRRTPRRPVSRRIPSHPQTASARRRRTSVRSGRSMAMGHHAWVRTRAGFGSEWSLPPRLGPGLRASTTPS